MNQTLLLLLSGLSLMALTGCSKTTVVLLESGKSHNAILVANEKGETKLDKVGSYVDISKKEKRISEVKQMSEEEINTRFTEALAMTPLKPLSYILYFEPNSIVLTEASKTTLQEALKRMEERSPCSVDIIGHTDTVGSNAANITVSLKRAKSIEALVQERSLTGVSLTAKGYGEEDLLVPTKDDVDEAKNRNVEIFIK